MPKPEISRYNTIYIPSIVTIEFRYTFLHVFSTKISGWWNFINSDSTLVDIFCRSFADFLQTLPDILPRLALIYKKYAWNNCPNYYSEFSRIFQKKSSWNAKLCTFIIYEVRSPSSVMKVCVDRLKLIGQVISNGRLLKKQ